MKIVTINDKTLYLTFHESSEQKQTSLLTQLTLLMQSNKTWKIGSFGNFHASDWSTFRWAQCSLINLIFLEMPDMQIREVSQILLFWMIKILHVSHFTSNYQ